VHKWRAEEQSILVGRKTVQNDDPSLTVREFSGNNPTRIIIDSQLQLSMDANIFSDEAPTIIFNRVKNEVKDNIEWIRISETNTRLILDELYKRNILSVFVEVVHYNTSFLTMFGMKHASLLAILFSGKEQKRQLSVKYQPIAIRFQAILFTIILENDSINSKYTLFEHNICHI
jgi:hypothetical protein